MTDEQQVHEAQARCLALLRTLLADDEHTNLDIEVLYGADADAPTLLAAMTQIAVEILKDAHGDDAEAFVSYWLSTLG